jgi:hypothetical protein
VNRIDDRLLVYHRSRLLIIAWLSRATRITLHAEVFHLAINYTSMKISAQQSHNFKVDNKKAVKIGIKS